VNANGETTKGFAVHCPLCGKQIQDDGPGEAKCNRCGLRLALDERGEITWHPEIRRCPLCQKRHRVREGMDLCPSCGRQIES
jgi:hypothetical protein